MNAASVVRKGVPTVILLLGLSALVACGSGEPPAPVEPPPRLVRTVTMAPPDGQNWRELPGRVEAARSAQLGFRTSGKLKEMLARESQDVDEGQVLARLDDTDERIEIERRRAEYEQVRSDFVRGKELVGEGLISRSDYQKLQAQEASAKAALASARQALDHTVLRAPFAGTVGKRYVDNFEEVSASQPIYLLQDLSSLTIKVDVPESLMIRVREGARPEVFAVFDTLPGRTWPLTLREIATQADAETSTFEVRFDMPPVDGLNVLPGMSVTVRGHRSPDVIVDDTLFYAPAQAVLEDDRGRFVWVAEPSGEGRATVRRRKVSTGELSGQGLAILGGLERGERVVVAGTRHMREGLAVRLGAE
ncbi:MAG: efflux RND transporter periplasmic adaptor subunit [Gammaproteobacteria bacterium]